ncbi:uncharacterized protein LOC120069122 [Benincasa hispida]|uniref:uncharacterized protein LOC120069122 n=1 Tax=Benincasa hispida TaxID=102211 RepID=UPI0019000536|nr:uncharacterized protein LOC120069122 [Benincasa hispida]
MSRVPSCGIRACFNYAKKLLVGVFFLSIQRLNEIWTKVQPCRSTTALRQPYCVSTFSASRVSSIFPFSFLRPPVADHFCSARTWFCLLRVCCCSIQDFEIFFNSVQQHQSSLGCLLLGLGLFWIPSLELSVVLVTSAFFWKNGSVKIVG